MRDWFDVEQTVAEQTTGGRAPVGRAAPSGSRGIAPSRERQDALVEQGIRGTENYFAWFEDPAESPVNRIEPVQPVPTRAGHPLGAPAEAG